MDKEDKKEIVGMFEHISEKMDKGFNDVRSEISDVRSEMETFRSETSENFREVRNDIKGLRTDLDLVEQTTESNKGFAKEIDILFGEVKNIKENAKLKESC